MMAYNLPGTIVIAPPSIPATILVPVVGVTGPQGPAGDETGLGFTWIQSQPAQTLLIQHGFEFRPAGILCIETDGITIEYDTVSYPQTGYIELTFGVPFVGVVYLS